MIRRNSKKTLLALIIVFIIGHNMPKRTTKARSSSSQASRYPKLDHKSAIHDPLSIAVIATMLILLIYATAILAFKVF